MRTRFLRHLWMLLFCVLAQAETAPTELLFAPDAVDLTPAPGTTANKARLLRLTDGTLVVAWHEGVGLSDGSWGLDGAVYAPRDIFIVASIDGGDSWSSPVNVSNTAALTDTSVFYDRVGDGTGLANYSGDSGKASVFAAGKNLVITWNDTYCGDGVHGPARYDGPLGMIEVPYHCLYVARLKISSGNVSVIAVARLTDGTRDVKNEVVRGTGAGFALAWQEDPAGLQLGEARGEGDGSSGARVTPGTDIWYAWITKSEFADATKPWHGPVPISDNFDYVNATVSDGGSSRPIMAMAGSPAYALLVYEEAKNSGPEDMGKDVRFHQFPFNAPPESEAGVIVSSPDENARRARVVAVSSPGGVHGTRAVLMWRQGEGIHGAPADFMMRIGSVPPGADLASVPDAGFRVADLSPAVDPEDPLNNELPLNISGARLSDATSVDPHMNAKAHRAVVDGDFIYAGYTQDPDAEDSSDEYQYLLRWSDDGGSTWSVPARVSADVPGSANVIEPRLLRTPGTVPSGSPEDIHNAEVFIVAWGAAAAGEGDSEPIRESLFVTRSVDRGMSFERVKALADLRTALGQTDEQIQLRVTPDGQTVYAVWIRRDADDSDVIFSSAVGITPTADLSIIMDATDIAPDVGDELEAVVHINNSGPQSATDLQLSIDVPEGLSLRAATPTSGACELAAPVTCSLDSLAPGASTTVGLSLVARTRGAWHLTAAVVARELEPEPTDNSADLVIEAIPNADISIGLALETSPVKSGELFDVRYEVFNSGPQTATGVTVTFMLPAHATVSDASGFEQAGERMLSRKLPDLLPDESRSGHLVFRAIGAGVASTLVIVGAVENDPDFDNNTRIIGVVIEAEESMARVADVGGGGCVHQPNGDGGMTLPIVLLLGLVWRLRKWTSRHSPSTAVDV